MKNYLQSQLQDILLKFDLNVTETAIITFLISSPQKTVLEIAKELNIARTSVYDQVEKLCKKGLLERIIYQNTTKYQAASVNAFEGLIKIEETKLADMKESFSALDEVYSKLSNTSPAGVVKYYHGVEGLRQMFWNEFQATEVLTYSLETLNEMIGKKFAEKHRQEEKIRKMKYREIINTEEPETIDNTKFSNVLNYDQVLECREISEKVFKIRQAMDIYNDTVAIINWGEGRRYGIEIIDKNFAQMQRDMFEYFWSIATPYQLELDS